MASERQRAAAERAARVKALFEQGLDDDQIAAAMGSTRDAVRTVRFRIGLAMDPAAKRAKLVQAAKSSVRGRASAERAARVRAMFEQGLNDAEIAAALGTDKDTIRTTRSRLKLAMPADEVLRRRQQAARSAGETLRSGAFPSDRVRPAPDVSHLYRGRRYDRVAVSHGD